MENTKLSVSMCVYGGDNAEHFAAAVDSILAQTVPPDEVVLVVDGPVPEALDAVIATLTERPDFRVIRFPENRGHGEARRAGLAACQNELVAIMDADDLSAPDRFERQLAALAADPTLAVVGGLITEFVATPEDVVGTREVALDDAAIKADMKKRCPMNLVTVMFRKSMVEAAGGFIDWYCEEDYYLWLRMAAAGMTFSNVGAVLVNVRVGEDMYRRRGGWRYFKSERALQKYMRKTGVIGPLTYLENVGKRLIVQVLLPNRLRGWVFKKFARKAV